MSYGRRSLLLPPLPPAPSDAPSTRKRKLTEVRRDDPVARSVGDRATKRRRLFPEGDQVEKNSLGLDTKRKYQQKHSQPLDYWDQRSMPTDSDHGVDHLFANSCNTLFFQGEGPARVGTVKAAANHFASDLEQLYLPRTAKGV